VPKAVFFDMDGTLVDSVDLHAASWARTFTHFGKMIPITRIRSRLEGGDQLLPHLPGQNSWTDADTTSFAERWPLHVTSRVRGGQSW
jgi:beta-phosphoglucomutase-like phosphatase (HAD superfamily)